MHSHGIKLINNSQISTIIIIIKFGGNQKWLSGGKKVSMTTLQVASTFEGNFS